MNNITEMLKETELLKTEVLSPLEENNEKVNHIFSLMDFSIWKGSFLVAALEVKGFRNSRGNLRDYIGSNLYELGNSDEIREMKFFHKNDKRRFRKKVYKVISRLVIDGHTFRKLFRNSIEGKTLVPASERIRYTVEGKTKENTVFLSKKEESDYILPIKNIAYYLFCKSYQLLDEDFIALKLVENFLKVYTKPYSVYNQKDFFALSEDGFLDDICKNELYLQKIKKMIHHFYQENKKSLEPFKNPPMRIISDRKFQRKVVDTFAYNHYNDKKKYLFYAHRTSLLNEEETYFYQKQAEEDFKFRLNVIKNSSDTKQNKLFSLSVLEKEMILINNWKELNKSID